MDICVIYLSSAPLNWDPPEQNRGEERGREGEAAKSLSECPQLVERVCRAAELLSQEQPLPGPGWGGQESL